MHFYNFTHKSKIQEQTYQFAGDERAWSYLFSSKHKKHFSWSVFKVHSTFYVRQIDDLTTYKKKTDKGWNINN